MNAGRRLKSELEAAVPGCRAGDHPQRQPVGAALAAGRRRTRGRRGHVSARRPDLRFDYCSNVTGVDWPAKRSPKRSRSRRWWTASRQRSKKSRRPHSPAISKSSITCISMELKHGPGRPAPAHRRTATDSVHLPSLTPVWRSAEFQEREIFDLLRSHLRRPSRPAPHPDVGRIQGPSHAQGLRRAGRLRIRADGARRSPDKRANAAPCAPR